ncbi:MAG: putative metal-binding motif-containing protein [Alphaproteobacteria bacterium]|nr:putative metal-binding motif-containing protein [Alphaproteobacteria bacterium]
MRVPTTLALLALGGCSWISGPEWDQVRDADGDGFEAPRFGGEDCRDDDPAIGPCDADGDGFDSVLVGGTDCDDGDPDVNPDVAWFVDADADGFGDPGQVLHACEPPWGTVADGTDCDDGDPEIHPGAVETCDPRDENCDPEGLPYDGADGSRWHVDADGDGFGTDERGTTASCAPGPGESLRPGDCDDTDPDVFPGADEVWYDGVDGDCDGTSDDDQDGDGVDVPADCDDTDPDRRPGAPERCNGIDDDCDGLVDDDDDDADQVGQLVWFVDADGDGHGAAGGAALQLCPGAAPARTALVDDDCNDAVGTIHPGAVERCDGVDQDCNGVADDAAVDAHTVWLDADGDGYGDQALTACGLPPGTADRDGDCNDADPDTYPGAPERCGDAFRQDCSGADPADCDRDGFPAPADCDDDPTHPQAPLVHPGAAEACNGWDDDCDGLVDGDDPDVGPTVLADWYADFDGDGFGSGLPVVTATCDPPPHAASNSLDCDDTRPTAHPGAAEACNGLDDDCDGTPDDGPTVGVPTYWYDADGDGFGDPLLARRDTCTPPGLAWVTVAGDCRDDDPTVSPSAAEICDAADNDCDGLVDGADPNLSAATWYADADGDGYGVDGLTVQACTRPAGRAPLGGDCADADPDRHPGAAETCNGGVDDDCDGVADDFDPDLQGAVLLYRDADGDRFGDPTTSAMRCVAGPDWVVDDSDCDDALAAVNPDAREVCNGVDDDCDGQTDIDDQGVIGVEIRFEDADGDGYGSVPIETCGERGVLVGGDCADGDPARHPYAEEVCDQLDDDCDGLVDDDPPNGPIWWPDDDGDGVPRLPLADEEVRACSPVANHAPEVLPGDVDCDDTSRQAFPGYPVELCDGLDNDCDGATDEDPADGALYWPDRDGDHYGRGTPARRCTGGLGLAANGDDCDDDDINVFPGHGCGTSAVTCTPPQPLVTCWTDADGDGYGSLIAGPTRAAACDPPLVDNPLDCNDALFGDVQTTTVTSTVDLQTAWADTGRLCLIIELGSPFASSPLPTLVPPGASYRRLVQGTANQVTLTPSAAPLVNFTSTSNVVLVDVPVDGSLAPAASRHLFELNSPGAKLGLVDLTVNGADKFGLVYQTGGQTWLEGVLGTGLHGTAFPHDGAVADMSSGTFAVARSGFVGASGTYSFDMTKATTFDDVVVIGSSPVNLAPFNAAISVSNLAVLGATAEGMTLVPTNSGTVDIDGLIVAGSGSDGIAAVTGLQPVISIQHASIVGNARGIVVDLMTLDDSIVVDSTGLDLTGSYTSSSGVMYVTGAGPARIGGVPGFVTWSPPLDPLQWDFHLGAASDAIGAGTGGDDLGRYRADDSWYCDSDTDGLPDGWELQHHGDLLSGGADDDDNDGSSNTQELARGTDPSDPDTDGDGQLDGSDLTPLG